MIQQEQQGARKSFLEQGFVRLEPSSGADPEALKAMKRIWCRGGGVRKAEECAVVC